MMMSEGGCILNADIEVQRKKKKQEKQALKAAKVQKARIKAQQQQQQLQQQRSADVEKRKKNHVKKQLDGALVVGEKKDLSLYPLDMNSSYDPSVVEAGWYSWWERMGLFDPDVTNRCADRIFSMVIPPPNVTGFLHLGHALTNSIEDFLARYYRMKGYRVLWVPGTDHAGIATQTVVEKRLYKLYGRLRREYTREEFAAEVFKWKEEYGSCITRQLRRMGSSLDWSRERFTMDSMLSEAVVEAFVRLYERGIIYRGTRLVNWSCRLQTAISDIEVDVVHIDGGTRMNVPGYSEPVEFGYLWDVRYEVLESAGYITVSTTRPETILGDVAIAVHPDDSRYRHFHGKRVKHPFVANRQMVVIADGEFVDMGFGTGAVKITPAHDLNDYNFGKKHGLKMINILNADGTINAVGGERFEGLPRYEARKKVLAELAELGLLEGRKEHSMNLGKCSRSGDVVEYLLVPQWWVRCDRMAKRALDAVLDGEIEIIPPTFVNTWNSWLSDCHDWCVSRQLWWGHRIPAWLVHLDGEANPNQEDMNNWVIARSEADAYVTARARFPGHERVELRQDDDVLDTWFSSGLFAFSVFGWPNEDAVDFKTYFPTSILETGHDILFFWVARMVMLSLELVGKVPFKKVLLHAMVRDSHGRKMSKALGNVIDPIDVIEGVTQKSLIDQLYTGNLDAREIERAIAGIKKDYPRGICECGTDALRFTLLSYTQQCRDINLDVQRIEANRNFCNKIWNATKLAYIFMGYIERPPSSTTPGSPPSKFVPRRSNECYGGGIVPKSKLDRWIISRLNGAMKSCDLHIQNFNFAGGCSAVHSFILYDFCDFYLEAVKPIFYENEGGDAATVDDTRQTVYTCLEKIYLMVHPFMPYLTEDLWQRLEKRPDHDETRYPSISIYPFPECDESLIDEALEKEVSGILDIVHSIRSMHVTYRINKKRAPPVVLNVLNNEEGLVQSLSQWIACIAHLTSSNDIQLSSNLPKDSVVSIPNNIYRICMLLKDSIDVQEVATRLRSEIQAMETQKASLSETAFSAEFSKMPKPVQDKVLSKLASIEQKIFASNTALDNLLDRLEI